MATINIRGIKTHYQELNPKAHETIVMVHGLVGNLAQFYFTIAPVLAEKYRVIMYDFKGHGKTEVAPSGYEVDTLADDLLELMHKLNVEDCYLLGFSFGGIISIKFALKYPDKVKKLAIIECPNPIAPTTETVARFKDVGVTGMKDMLPESVQKNFFGNERTLEKSRKASLKLFNTTTIAVDIDKDKDLSDHDLAAISQEVILLYGKTSDCNDMAQRIMANAPKAVLKMKDGGHFFLMEATNEVSAELKEFFRETEIVS